MESTPQVANANMMENTATITIRFEDSALEGNETLFLSSSTDSFIYVIMLCIFSINPEENDQCPFFVQHGRRDSNSRHLVLETSALPTELHPFLITLKGITPLA